MKWSLIFLFLLIPFVSAASLDIKESYKLGETIIGSINGSIIQLNNENVELLRGHVQVAFDYDVKKLGDSYFIYGLTPMSPNTYTLLLRDIQVSQNGQIKLVNISSNITVINETSSYSVKPGSILTQNDFQITLTSNKESSETLYIDGPQKFEFQAKPGENMLDFSVDNFPPGFSIITVASYSIPVYIIKNESEQENNKNIIFFPDEIDEVILVGERATFPIRIVNRANSTSKIEFLFDKKKFSISPDVDEIRANSAINFNLTVLDDRNLDETIKVIVGNETIILPVIISYTENESQILPTNNSTVEAQFYCAELNGVQCSTDQLCSGDTMSALDGSCCIGTCSLPSKKGYSWLGYGLVAVVLIILVVIGGRYLKSRNSGDSFSTRVGSADKKLIS